MLSKNYKVCKILYLKFFILFFLLLSIGSSIELAGSEKFRKVNYEKENAIFLDSERTYFSYISMRISKVKILEIFKSNGDLNNFIDDTPIYKIVDKKIREKETKVKTYFIFTILQRYRDRLLRI